MECIKFELSGKTAFFKQPDTNNYCYFTYNHVHKMVLLGILGAILGYNGKSQYKIMLDNNIKCGDYPEYYEKLQGLKISIVPFKPHFFKSVQSFNNSTGHASKEDGGNLIVRQQWLESVKWDIYLMQGDIEDSVWSKIKEYLLESKAVFETYLGANNHKAQIDNVKVVNLKECKDIYKIDSLFFENAIEELGDVWDEELREYDYREYMPIGLDKLNNLYILEKIRWTNREVVMINNTNDIYNYNENILFFF